MNRFSLMTRINALRLEGLDSFVGHSRQGMGVAWKQFAKAFDKTTAGWNESEVSDYVDRIYDEVVLLRDQPTLGCAHVPNESRRSQSDSTSPRRETVGVSLPFANTPPGVPEHTAVGGCYSSDDVRMLLRAAPNWCRVVHRMARTPRKPMKTLQNKSVAALGSRVSVSLTDDQHEFLSGLAERKRVSLAWVIRDAIERLIAEESPLFKSASTRGETA